MNHPGYLDFNRRQLITCRSCGIKRTSQEVRTTEVTMFTWNDFSSPSDTEMSVIFKIPHYSILKYFWDWNSQICCDDFPVYENSDTFRWQQKIWKLKLSHNTTPKFLKTKVSPYSFEPHGQPWLENLMVSFCWKHLDLSEHFEAWTFWDFIGVEHNVVLTSITSREPNVLPQSVKHISV